MFSHIISYAKKLLAIWRNEDWETGERLLPLQSGMRETGTACISTLIKGLLKILHNQLSVFILIISQNSSHKTVRPVKLMK